MMTTQELRARFLSFFEKNNHQLVRSSSLIPHQDPTLLFTNAGMNQFKDVFTGQEKRPYVRATTSQKCVRAGGKHNDLEQVGFTKRHQTFFEMLGNFSFGDYFKEDAIRFAWDFLTKDLKMSSKDLWVSVFEKDDEAAEIWHRVTGISKDRIVKMGEKDNFWAMGDTGPCGPCSEIYVDRGDKFGKPGEVITDGGERFLEIWNLVFMQYDRQPSGELVPLPKPSVDTGMGLERLASVIQNVESNYLTDGMQNILNGFSKLLKKPYGVNAEDDLALRVLTDHIRAVSFLMADGAQPSNEGRGYVLRRILRRAIRYGKKLGCTGPFFHEGVSYVIAEMGQAYPELVQNRSAIQKLIHVEEERFFETLDNGLRLLDQRTSDLKPGSALPGSVAFQLYDTFGFPVDLTEVILREKGFELDHAGFEKELEAQRSRSRASWKGSGDESIAGIYKEMSLAGLRSDFVGYEKYELNSPVLALIQGGKKVDRVQAGDFEVVLQSSPFYAAGGGQVGDQGTLSASPFEAIVTDSLKPTDSFYVLKAKLKSGEIKTGQSVLARIDLARRLKTRANHSTTHLLHAALQLVLGEHVKQAGSLVNPDYLRFDFNHFQSLTKEEIARIEKLVNEQIRANQPIAIVHQSLEQAVAGGAKAFFEDKYGDEVRVVSFGDFSKELCGGTHVERTGEAGFFKITSESSVASGVRRIVAVTGEKAFEFVKEQEAYLESLAELLKTNPKDLMTRIEKLLKEKAELQKKASQPSASAKEFKIETIESVATVIEIAEVEDSKDLRVLSDLYKQKIRSGVVLVGARLDGKASLLIAVSDDMAAQFAMPKFVQLLQSEFSMKGGGKPQFAQLGGPDSATFTRDRLIELTKSHIKGLVLAS